MLRGLGKCSSGKNFWNVTPCDTFCMMASQTSQMPKNVLKKIRLRLLTYSSHSIGNDNISAWVFKLAFASGCAQTKVAPTTLSYGTIRRYHP